jgi:hypothetical protein
MDVKRKVATLPDKLGVSTKRLSQYTYTLLNKAHGTLFVTNLQQFHGTAFIGGIASDFTDNSTDSLHTLGSNTLTVRRLSARGTLFYQITLLQTYSQRFLCHSSYRGKYVSIANKCREWKL